MNKNILNDNDLANNPTTRVPICLCLDTSGSMNRIICGERKRTGEQVFSDGVNWDVVTGGRTAIAELTDGINMFYDAIRSDDTARYSAEICIVTFGANGAQLVEDFTGIDQKTTVTELVASGETPMGEAVNLAIDCLQKRKRKYKVTGIDYFQPWLVLMTDGEPNGSKDELNAAMCKAREMVANRELVVFPVGIGDSANLKVISNFSPRMKALKLGEMKFKEFFEWLSASVATTAKVCMDGQTTISPDLITEWDELLLD